jgi:hypothetical protein
MSDQISTLLAEGADRVDIPAAPTSAILSRGRALRRRRRTVRTGAVLAGIAGIAVVAVTSSLLAPGPGPGPDGFDDLAAAVAPDPDGWAVAQGSTVHLGNGRTVEVPGKVKAMYYTSAGVMVRTGRTAYTEGDAVSNYFVLEGDGDVRDFALDLGDKKPGSDPTLPYLAYSVKGSDATHWELVLRDVRTGEVATRVAYEGTFTWGGWNAPPTALSGDFAYVGVDEATLAINWRTGAVAPAAGLSPSRMPTVAGGRDLVETRERVPDGVTMVDPQEQTTQTHTVVDAVTGETVRTIKITGTVFETAVPQLSSDGRHVLVASWLECDERNACRYGSPTSDVIDLETGERRAFTLGERTYGWSPDGRLLLVDDTEVRSCDASTGACESTDVRLEGDGPVRVSGNDNES